MARSHVCSNHMCHTGTSFMCPVQAAHHTGRLTHVLQCLQVVMDEPCAVHYVGILGSRDLSFPTAAQVYNYRGLNGLVPDFNGTINVTQAGIPFSSGRLLLLLPANPVLMLANMTPTACLLKPGARLCRSTQCQLFLRSKRWLLFSQPSLVVRHDALG